MSVNLSAHLSVGNFDAKYLRNWAI